LDVLEVLYNVHVFNFYLVIALPFVNLTWQYLQLTLLM
jgi:hypothetical protein